MLLATGLALKTVQAATDVPALNGAANGVRSLQVFQGWPVLVQATLFHPQILDSNAIPLTITADAGRWSDLLTLHVLDSAGAAVSWPLALLNSPGTSITLDAQKMGQLTWALTPEQTLGLPTGSYQIGITLDTATVSNQFSWKGTVACVPVDIQLDSEPALLTPIQTEAKYTTFSQYYDALGNSREAMHQIDLLLLADSNNIEGLSLKASLLADLNQNRDALTFGNQALAQVRLQFPNTPEAPQELLRLRGELMRKLLPGRFNSVAVTNDTISLEWNVNPGHSYNLEHSPDLRTWTVLAPGLISPTNVLSWSTNRLQALEFFRIR